MLILDICYMIQLSSKASHDLVSITEIQLSPAGLYRSFVIRRQLTKIICSAGFNSAFHCFSNLTMAFKMNISLKDHLLCFSST